MKSFIDQNTIVQQFHQDGKTIEAALFLLEEFQMQHPNFAGFELREMAKPSFVLMTTEGVLGEPQIVKIPENTFEFPLILMLNLLAHEMVHVRQKDKNSLVEDKNEREWQAYYEMIFHDIFPLVPNLSDNYQIFFCQKALEYFHRMPPESGLRATYYTQKIEIEHQLYRLKDGEDNFSI